MWNSSLRFLLFSVLLTGAFNADAQFEKGSFQAGLNVPIPYINGSGKWKDNGPSIRKDYDYTYLGIQVEGGYFLTKRLILGLNVRHNLGYTRSSDKFFYNRDFHTLGLFGRYHALSLFKNTTLYLSAGFELGRELNYLGQNDGFQTENLYAGFGLQHRFSKHFSTDIGLILGKEYYRLLYRRNDFSFSTDYSIFAVQWRLNYHFGLKSKRNAGN